MLYEHSLRQEVDMALQKQSGKNMGGMLTGIPRFQLDCNSFYELHRLVCIKSLPVSGHSRFASHLALYFPEAAARIDEFDFGILHLEVGALKLVTRDAIAKRDWEILGEHFSFVAGIIEDAGTELGDALHVSYLGSLFYGETTLNFAKARSLLPKTLASALEKVEHHYEGLVP